MCEGLCVYGTFFPLSNWPELWRELRTCRLCTESGASDALEHDHVSELERASERASERPLERSEAVARRPGEARARARTGRPVFVDISGPAAALWETSLLGA